jgi:hypothetical protein
MYVFALFLAGGALLYFFTLARGEQSGSSPTSSSTSRIKEAYDWLVAKGTNYGSTDAADWSNNWGTYWNRIMESAAWEPDGTATVSDCTSGATFYAGSDNRTQKTGTSGTCSLGTYITNQENMAYDDYNCSNNNEEGDTACAGGDSEYTGEEASTWSLEASGGTARSVTDNGSTVTLSSNKVYQDSVTGLYWTDGSSGTVDNEFSYVDGDDRSSPTGNSCNFNAAGDPNTYCDNQDPLNAYSEDDDVSAADFCLYLQLDGDNADTDDDGATGMETDWRLPTQKELMLAYINGAGNNLPNANGYHWSSTEFYSSQSIAWSVSLGRGYTYSATKSNNYYVRCVRRD